MTLGEWIIHLESGFEDYPIEQEYPGEVTRQDIKDLIEMLVELHQRRTTKKIEALKESHDQVIYIPTEAGIPVTESARFFKMNQGNKTTENK